MVGADAMQDASVEPLFYRESGRFPPLSLPLLLLASSVAGVGFGAVYGVLQYVNPFIYVSLFITIG